MPTKTNECFVQEAISIHGEKYNYSKTFYVKANKNVTIICNIHGEFEQKPTYHLQGKGCKKCAGNYSSKKYFIEKANKKHFNKYDYTRVIYKNANTKVIIICNEHGEFKQRPGCHVYGQQCPKCSLVKCHNNLKKTTKEFIEKSIEKHGNKYDYSSVKYKNAHVKVTIVCKKHNFSFKQSANQHLKGDGCPKCGKNYMDKKFFIEKAIKVHGDLYNYNKVIFPTINKKVKIICKKHGLFKQNYNNHLNGNKCPKCFATYSKIQIEWLQFLSVTSPNIQYMLNNENGEYIIPELKIRVDGIDHETLTVLEFHGDYYHGNPKIYYHNDINKVTNKLFGVLFKNTLHRELFIRNLGYDYKCIWEYEWRKAVKSVIILQRKWRKIKISKL